MGLFCNKLSQRGVVCLRACKACVKPLTALTHVNCGQLKSHLHVGVCVVYETLRGANSLSLYHALHGTAAINHHFTKHTLSDLPLLLYIQYNLCEKPANGL